MTSHDQLFKNLLERFFPDLLHIVLPDLSRRLVLDRESIVFLDGEHFTDLPRGRRRQVDLLAQICVAGGSEELILVHVEIERVKRSSMGSRIGRYAMALQLRHDRPVIPIVIYLQGGQSGIRERIYHRHLEPKELMRLTYWELALSPTPARDLLALDRPLAWALAALTRGGDLSPARHKLECVTRILRSEIPLDPVEQYLLLNCVETYVELDGADRKEFETMIAEPKYADVLSIYDSGVTWEDKIRIEGQRRLVLRLLERRFGTLPGSANDRVEALDSSEELERLAEAILSAETLADLDLQPG